MIRTPSAEIEIYIQPDRTANLVWYPAGGDKRVQVIPGLDPDVMDELAAELRRQADRMRLGLR